MTSPAAPLPESRCASCGAAVESGTSRCPSCGLSRPTGRGAQVFGHSGFWLIGVVLLAVYLVVLLIVAAAR